MATHEENTIQRLREEIKANKDAAQARTDKLLARMAALYEQLNDYEKQVNELNGVIHKLQHRVGKTEDENKTLKANQTISDEGYVQKLEELEHLLVEGEGASTILKAIKYVRKMRGVA